MRLFASLLLLALLACAAAPAAAGPILDRIKAEGVVRCGGVGRPGLVEIAPDGQARGLELDLCRAIASVVLGKLADATSIIFVVKACSFLPLLGLLTAFLPNLKNPQHGSAAGE